MTTQRPSTHLCIATGQNLANLIPALQLKANRVIILETPQMRLQARHLQRALEGHGIQVVREAFDDSTPAAVEQSAERIGVHYGEGSIVFNVTGGHKLMTLALARHMEVADDLHLLYAETRNQRLDWLRPVPELQAMENALDIDDFLLAQGYTRDSFSERDAYWQQAALDRAALTRMLGDESDRLASFFGALNKLAANAMSDARKGTPFRPQQRLLFTPGGRNADVLARAHELGLIHWDQDIEIVFASDEVARYFGGGWLEEYVWLKLRGIRPHDSATNLTVKPAGGDIRNELDAVVAHGNRLLVIECKTLRFGNDPLKDADYVYKLAQLSKQIGGGMASSLLLSARPLDEATAERAQRYGVTVLAGAGTKKLASWIQQWMAGA